MIGLFQYCVMLKTHKKKKKKKKSYIGLKVHGEIFPRTEFYNLCFNGNHYNIQQMSISNFN